MNKIEFWVPTEPKAQGRVRFATRDKRGNPLPFARKYVDGQTANVRSVLADSAAVHRAAGALYEGPIKFTMVVFRLKPKSYSRARWAWDTKPDCDNFGKLKDAFNGVLWRDDSQIVEEHLYKVQSLDRQGFLIIVEEAMPSTSEMLKINLRNLLEQDGGRPDGQPT